MNKLNLGCGKDVRVGYDNFDIEDFDLNEFPYPLNKRYNEIILFQVLEHLIYPDRVLKELVKYCTNKAHIFIEVPHYSNFGAYNNLQHLHYFNERAFKDFSLENKEFKLINLEVTPTKVGRFLPNIIRRKLSLFLNGLNGIIKVEYEIIK